MLIQFGFGQVRLGQVMLCQVVLGQVRLGYVMLGQFRLGYVRSCQVRLGYVRLGQIRLCYVSLGQVMFGHVRLGQVRSSYNFFVVESKPSPLPVNTFCKTALCLNSVPFSLPCHSLPVRNITERLKTGNYFSPSPFHYSYLYFSATKFTFFRPCQRSTLFPIVLW